MRDVDFELSNFKRLKEQQLPKGNQNLPTYQSKASLVVTKQNKKVMGYTKWLCILFAFLMLLWKQKCLGK